MKMTSRELHRLCKIAQAAGRSLMQVYGSGVEVSHKADASPLTQADLRADAIICSELARAFPGVAILSEESGSSQDSDGETFFLVDPLDGTKEFLDRSGEFTVNIGLIVGGVPVAGVVVAPALGECYYAARDLGAWKSGLGKPIPIRVQNYERGSPLRIVGSRSHGAARLNERIELLGVPHRYTPIGSSLKFCRVAEGRADIYPRFGPTSQWDTAAAQCVLENAGGWVLDLNGQALRYRWEGPALNPEFLAMGDRSVFELFQWAHGASTGAGNPAEP